MAGTGGVVIPGGRNFHCRDGFKRCLRFVCSECRTGPGLYRFVIEGLPGWGRVFYTFVAGGWPGPGSERLLPSFASASGKTPGQDRLHVRSALPGGLSHDKYRRDTCFCGFNQSLYLFFLASLRSRRSLFSGFFMILLR